MRQSGVVRGAGRQNWAAATNLLVYWVLGVPLAVWLAFRLRLGVFGLWGGLVIICCLQARTQSSMSLVPKEKSAVKHTAFRHGCTECRSSLCEHSYCVASRAPASVVLHAQVKLTAMHHRYHLVAVPELAACARRGPS